MKFSIRAAIFVVLALMSNLVLADKDVFQDVLDRYVMSVNDLDLDLAEKLWSQTEDVSFIHPRGHQKGWEDIKNSFYLGAMGGFSKRSLRLKDVSVRILSDDTAWSDFYWDFSAVFKNDGTEMNSAGRETQIWKREGDGWKIVHVHYSNMPVTGEREGF